VRARCRIEKNTHIEVLRDKKMAKKRAMQREKTTHNV
jgi:hypothetical protein